MNTSSHIARIEEVIGYMLSLLDPVKDAAEIAQLKKDQTTLSTP